VVLLTYDSFDIRRINPSIKVVELGGGEFKLHHKCFLDTTDFIEELLKMKMLKKLIIINIIKISLLGSASNNKDM
jgi:hypothetical protein